MWGFLGDVLEGAGAITSFFHPGIGAAIMAGGALLQQVGAQESKDKSIRDSYKKQEFTEGAQAYNSALKQYYGTERIDASSGIVVSSLKKPKISSYISNDVVKYGVDSNGYITDPSNNNILYNGLEQPTSSIDYGSMFSSAASAATEAYSINKAYTKYKNSKTI